MLSLKHQKGIIQLGIIGIFILTGALFAGTILVNNKNLTFFNIAEKAAGVEKQECKGCVGKYELRWDRNANGGEGECKKRASAACKENKVGSETCAGQCITKGNCASQGLVNASGSCIKGICCQEQVKKATPTAKAKPTPFPKTPTPEPSFASTPTPTSFTFTPTPTP